MKNSVRQFRIRKEITQSQLAEVLGVSRQTIYAIETGKYIPSTILALKLSAYFKTEVEELFELEADD